MSVVIIALPASVTCADTRTGELKFVGQPNSETSGTLTSLVPIPFEAYIYMFAICCFALFMFS